MLPHEFHPLAARELEREVQHVQVTSHDGTILDGWLSFPALPEGVKAPVILMSTPYLGTVLFHPAGGPWFFRHPGSDVPSGGTLEDGGRTGSLILWIVAHASSLNSSPRLALSRL